MIRRTNRGCTAAQTMELLMEPCSPTRETVSCSEITSWLSCRKKHEFRYVRCLAPLEDSEPLNLGRAVHAGLESWYLQRDQQSALNAVRESLDGCSSEMELLPKALGMIEGYIKYWKNREDLQTLHVELPFRVPLRTPSGRSSRIYDLVGRVDGIVQKPDGSIWILEHKTLGRKDKHYFDKLDVDIQVRAYCWAIRRFTGLDVQGVIYNVLRSKLPARPEILKSGKLSKRANIDTTYEIFSNAIADNSCDPNEYAEILERLKTEGNTFFMRREVEFTSGELDSFSLDLYRITRDMRRSSREESYRNPTACGQFGPCSFRDLCIGTLPQDEVFEHYRELSTKHPELSDVDLDALKPVATRTPSNEKPEISDDFLNSLLDDEPPLLS